MGFVHRIGAEASALALGGTLLLGGRDARASAGLDDSRLRAASLERPLEAESDQTPPSTEEPQ
jgi:hypothetical protein